VNLRTVGAVVLLWVGLDAGRMRPAAAETYPIDLAATLRLAGAQNLDLQRAREALREAQANRTIAVEQFFPWLGIGAIYHRRDGFAQAVPAGTVSDTHFQSYAPGGTVTAQVVLGDAIYNALASKQLLHASEEGVEAARRDTTLTAARQYFDLARDGALVGVARQALETSQDYQRQLHEAVSVGIAFKGDELRVQTQTELYQIAVEQALADERIVAARLAETLHLDATVELVPSDTGLAPLRLFGADAPLDALVARALASRPELGRSRALVSAARDAERGAVYGPLLPTLGGQAFVGGLGGGHDGEPEHFGSSRDYTVGMSWRIGPGGMFDFGRADASEARRTIAELDAARVRDAVVAEVVEDLALVRSLAQQIDLAQRNLATATDTLRLTHERKQYGVGIVLEEIQSQQALNQSRSDFVTKVAEFNQAQYGLNRAVGGTPEPEPPR
jgi:outer membrane protein TolC